MITKLGVGIVTKGEMEARTACCLIVALNQANVPSEMLLGEGCYIHLNREYVTELAKKVGCSHLLFVDTDVMFDGDAIKKLIDADKDIVGGRYNKRMMPIESTVKENITELSEVAFLPTGFMLINMEVFNKMPAPYFSFESGAESEDKYFCDKAIANGIKVWCDPTINIGHIGKVVF